MPKDHHDPKGNKITIFCRRVRRHNKPIIPLSKDEEARDAQKPYLVFCQGGPGKPAPQVVKSVQNTKFLDRGYQMLYIDYRGTGLSMPVTAATLTKAGDAYAQADYLKLFRADNIVRDLEAIRQRLTADFPPEARKWSLHGQSYGGFVALTYLSFYPSGLREVFITAGLAPVGHTASEVYKSLYKKVKDRNEAYLAKYPEDSETLRRLVMGLHRRGSVPLPGGGKLTARRLMSLGSIFDGHGGLDRVHNLLLRMRADLDQFEMLTWPTLSELELATSIDGNPLYALLHEAIYCDGTRSNWAAFRVGRKVPELVWLRDEQRPTRKMPGDFDAAETDTDATKEYSNTAPPPPPPPPPAPPQTKAPVHGIPVEGQPYYFSGEMIYPFFFEDQPQLAFVAEAAHLLATFDGWGPLYDQEQLRRNEVPVYAVSYTDDMCVDAAMARETAAMIRGCRMHETNALYHNAVRAHPDEVYDMLFKLRDDTLD